MSNFNDDFDINLPVGSSFARNGQVELRKTRRSLQERFDLEHFGPGLGNQDNAHPGADGRHRPGKTSVTLLDTESNILATTPGASGALAFATDTGILYFWNGTNWTSNKMVGANTLALPKVDLSSAGIWSYDGFAGTLTVPLTNALDGDEATYDTWTYNASVINPGFRVDLTTPALYEILLVYSMNKAGTGGRGGIRTSLESTNFQVRHADYEELNFNPTNTTGVWSGKAAILFKAYCRFFYIGLKEATLRIHRLEARKLG
jgi:hypothetical protein